jgi:hypothetical protein
MVQHEIRILPAIHFAAAIYFGLNGRDCQMTFLVEKPDRRDEGSAEENLLKHFPELKRIEVVHVVKMQLKVSQLKHAKFVAYEVQHKRRLDDDDDDDMVLWKTAGGRLDDDDDMVLCL